MVVFVFGAEVVVEVREAVVVVAAGVVSVVVIVVDVVDSVPVDMLEMIEVEVGVLAVVVKSLL